MLIAGIDKFSLNEFPGYPCIIIFTQGCNFQCPFCYNPQLIDTKLFGKPLPEEKVLEFLELRKKFCDAVVITGGEPTIHKDLLQFVKKIKKLGYKVKLNTNGSNPKMLKQLISKKLIDYVQMDIKGTWKNYNQLTGKTGVILEDIKKSINLVATSKIPNEFRTTDFKYILSEEDIKEIKQYVKLSNHIVNEYLEPTQVISDYITNSLNN